MFTFAQAAEAAAPAAQQSSILGSLLPLVFLFAIFYFIIIRPQQKQQKKHKQMLGQLKKGDKIVTTGGLIVDIEKVEENFYNVKLNKETHVRLTKESVARLYEPIATVKDK